METLEKIKNCHVCGGVQMVPRIQIPVPDIMTNEEILRDVLQCEECDTIHYIDDGTVAYEFTYRVGRTVRDQINIKYTND